MKKFISIVLVILFVISSLGIAYYTNQNRSAEDSSASVETGYDIIIIAGQSNSYFGSGQDTNLDGDNRDIYQLGRGTQANQIIPATDPLAFHSTPPNKISFAMTFARMYRDSGLLAPGRKILLLPQSKGATGFSKGDWKVGDPLYQDTVTRANVAMSKPGTNKIIALLWHQGEADAAGSQTQEQYQQNFLNMINGYQNEINGFDQNTPVLVGQMVPSWISNSSGNNAVNINNAHKNLPNLRPLVAFVSAEAPFEIGKDDEIPLNLPNELIHYSATSQRILGKRYFDAFLDLVLENNLTSQIPNYCNIDYAAGASEKWFFPNAQSPSPQLNAQYLEAYKEIVSWGGIFNWHAQMWNTHNAGRNEYNFVYVDGPLDWHEQNNLQMEYHSLIWHKGDWLGIPNDGRMDWYENLTVAERRAALQEYINHVMARYKDRIYLYHVVNHAVAHGPEDNFMLTGWSRTEAIDKFFRWARQADPSATLVINEGNIFRSAETFNKYVALLEELKTLGTPIDVVGIMTHEGYDGSKIEDLSVYKNRLTRIASIGYTLQISEIDIGMDEDNPIDPNQPFEGFNSWWDYQAWAYGELYDLFVNFPSMQYIFTWGFYDGQHWRDAAGYYFDGSYGQQNFSKKPSYYEIERYVQKKGCIGKTFTLEPFCTSNGTPRGRVQWSKSSDEILIRVDDDPVFGDDDGLWRHIVADSTITFDRIPVDYTPIAPQTSNLTLEAGKTYYVQVRDQITGESYVINDQKIGSFVAPSCTENLDTCSVLDNNENSVVDLSDVVSILSVYQTQCTQPASVPSCGTVDTNSDGEVNLIDIVYVLGKYRKSCM